MQTIKIDEGGQLDIFLNSKNRQIEKVTFFCREKGKIEFLINDNILTFLSLQEAIDLKNSLMESIHESINKPKIQ